jgi:hypothetical protein
MFYIFFLQFNHSTLDWLKIEFYNYFSIVFYAVIVLLWLKLFCMFFIFFFNLIIQHYYFLCSYRTFMTQVILYVFYFFLQFNHSTLGWLEIEFYNYFSIVFYAVIVVLWLESRLSWLTQVFFCFFCWFFFQFYPSILDWLWIRLHNLF